MANTKNTLGKSERLKSRKRIDFLFTKGKSFHAHPIKVLFARVEEGEMLQAGVTVSSRNFKKAVDRNRVKRLLREAYRTQKSELQEILLKKDKRLIVFFIYVAKEMPVFADVYDKMGLLLKRVTTFIANDKVVS